MIERNSIGLLSNYHREVSDRPSTSWLGSHSDRERVRGPGLWNNNHVDEDYDPRFLSLLERCVGKPPPVAAFKRPEADDLIRSKTHYTQLRLDPLGRESAAEMLQSLLGYSAALAPLKRLIIRRCNISRRR